jgi:hypothetical protein
LHVGNIFIFASTLERRNYALEFGVGEGECEQCLPSAPRANKQFAKYALNLPPDWN